MPQKTGIDKPITPHKLRHTYATDRLDAGAERADIQALPGHESIATTGAGGGAVVSVDNLCVYQDGKTKNLAIISAVFLLKKFRWK